MLHVPKIVTTELRAQMSDLHGDTCSVTRSHAMCNGQSLAVPARLWSGEGRRGGVPTSAGTDRRGTGQAVGEVRWDAGVHGQDFPPLARAYRCVAPFFFPVLEPSAPTTSTSWGRHSVRAPATERCLNPKPSGATRRLSQMTDACLGGALVGWPRGLWGA